jgi:hypothetical protein
MRDSLFSAVDGGVSAVQADGCSRRFCRLAKTLYIVISENYRAHITYNAETLFCKNKVERGIMIISVSFLPSVNSSVAKIYFQEIL